MEKVEKRLSNIQLFNLYSGLLSQTQKEILFDYLCLDLSITEISEERKISRAAVEDAIRKGLVKLEDYEKSVSMLQKMNSIKEKVESLMANCTDEEQLKVLKEIVGVIDSDGIWESDRKAR